MSLLAFEQAYQLRQQIKTVGRTVTVRDVTTLTGANPAANPPTVATPVVNGAHSIGATSLALRATRLVGRLIAGDRIVLAGYTYTVTAQAIASGNALTAAITPALATAPADGAAVTFVFLADTRCVASVANVPLRMIDGSAVQSGDRSVTVAAADIAFRPIAGDQVLIDGDVYNVVGVRVSEVAGTISTYNLQVRR